MASNEKSRKVVPIRLESFFKLSRLPNEEREKYFYPFGGFLILLIIVFACGPKIKIDTTLHPLILPKNLDEYITRSESSFSGMFPGTEKKITWAGKVGEQTPFAIVYIHGFSASRQDTAPLANQVAEQIRANLYCTRLTGHGRGAKAMMDGSVNAWLNDMHEAMEIGKRLGKRVIIMGNSTGGTLTAWQAAQQDTEEIAATVLISPNFGPADRMASLLTWPWGGLFGDVFIGKNRSWQP